MKYLIFSQMRKYLKVVSFSILLINILSCGSSDDSEKNHVNLDIQDNEDFSNIEVLFNENQFTDTTHISLLKELKICNAFQKDTSNYMEPACSPRFFKIFPISSKIPVEDAFLVLIKSKVSGIKLRRVVVFVREKGELVKVNAFVANIIGMKNGKGDHKDLLLRFNDNVDGEVIFYNCQFKWNGTQYQFETTDAIEGYEPDPLNPSTPKPWRQTIKSEFKDSVSKEIYNDLITNQMIL
jgi:hypothetical protein